VFGRLLVVGVAWVAALGLFAAFLQWFARPTHHLSPAQNAASDLVRALNRASPTTRNSPAWVVTRATSAYHTMVIDLNAEHPEDARQIAAAIVMPVQDRYEELLIYIKAVDTSKDPMVRRIQWTRQGGYVENDYSGAPSQGTTH
jgi:hypothetical protein